ncbi:MAG: VanZ family protein [Nitrospira sp.]|nr:VanZ family protein [Nitrospira sp.]MCP9463535.1 VanZ family protein [Nitrospira sp.]
MGWLRYWGPVCVYAGLIFYLSSLPNPQDKLPSFIGLLSDKVLHAVEYAILGGLFYRAFRWGTNDAVKPWAGLLAVLATSLYGLSDEIHQAFVPNRESSGWDWLADSVGASLGVVTVERFIRWWPKSPVPEPHRR